MIRRLRPCFQLYSVFSFIGDRRGSRLVLLRHFSSAPSPHRCRNPPLSTAPSESTTLADLISRGLRLSPATLRRFWRTRALLPENVLFVLRRFWEEDRHTRSLRKAHFCLDMFRWAETKQELGSEGFRHLPESYSILASLLLRCCMFPEAESLISGLGAEAAKGGFTSRLYSAVSAEVYGAVMKGYAEEGRMAKAVALYDDAKGQGLPLSYCCYRSLLASLLESEDGPAFARVYMDAVRFGRCFSGDDGKTFLDFAVRSLCKNNRVLEAAELLRRATTPSMAPTATALDAIALGYCQKQDFADLLAFLQEWNHVPTVRICNKIVSSLCMKSGVDEASAYLRYLERLGFNPDSKTFGILIGWSCRENKTRDAFLRLSQIFSRRLVPDVHAYNSLIAGIFIEGMWRYAKMVYADMVEAGVSPQYETFRVLLAGYCKERQFDLARMIFDGMVQCGVASLAPTDDAMSKVFLVLGLDCLGVKIKRVSSTGFQEAEFYDSLGNGLYLDVDVDEYDKMLNKILVDAFVPNFDIATMKQCQIGKIDAALRLRLDCILNGQNLSMHTSATLVKCLLPYSHARTIVDIVDSSPELLNHLDPLNLNLIIQKFSNEGLLVKARQVFGILLKRELPVEAETFRVLLIELFNRKMQWDFLECWKMARSSGYLPGITDIKDVLTSLCTFGMLIEVKKLYKSMLSKFPESVPETSKSFLEVLCCMGHVKFGYELVTEFWEPDVYSNMVTVNLLIKCLSQEKKFAELLEVLDSLQNENIPISTAIGRKVVPLFCRFGNLDRAITIKQIMVTKQPETYISVCKTLVSNLCKYGFMKEAVIQLHEVVDSRLFHDRTVLNSLTLGYCKEGNWNKVREILNIILKLNGSLVLSSYRSLVQLLCRQGRFYDLIHLQNVYVNENRSDALPFYNILIFCLLQKEHCFLVDRVLDEMSNKNLPLDQVTYNFLFYGYSKCGSIGRPLEILCAMIKMGMRLNNRSCRIAMTHLYGNEMYITKAVKLAKIMDDWSLKLGSVAQTALVERLLTEGNLEAADSLVYRFIKNHFSRDVISFDILIRRSIEKGMIETAMEIFNTMLERDGLPSEASYNLVIRHLLDQRDLDQALDFLAEMQHNGLELTEDLCKTLINDLCRNRRVDDAKMVLEGLLKSGINIPQNHIRAVIDAYYAENNISTPLNLINKMQQNGHLPDFEMQWSLISNLSGDNNGNEFGKSYVIDLLSEDGLSASLTRNSKKIGHYTTEHHRLS